MGFSPLLISLFLSAPFFLSASFVARAGCEAGSPIPIASAVACAQTAGAQTAGAQIAGTQTASVGVVGVLFPVTLSDGNTYPVIGFLYYQQGSLAGDLQVLVHGATYDHTYWDIPDLDGVSYSYARYMVGRGYAVLAIDTIGAGDSVIVENGNILPNGDFLDMNETVSALHQVLAEVRAVDFFTHLALVGHSFGAEQAVLVQAQYGQADALVVTGWGHTVTPFPPVSLPTITTPYIAADTFTTQQVAGLFYYQPETDPAMIQLNQTALSSTISRGQFTDVYDWYGNRALDMSTAVTSPVLVQFGDNDALYPSAAEAPSEASYWRSSPGASVVTLPSIGHVLNAHLDHLESWTSIDQFLRSLFP